jgi:hypothetical protein
MALTPAPTGMSYDNLVITLQQYLERGGGTDTTVDYQMPLIINRAERSLADKLKIQGYRYVLTSEVQQAQPVVTKPDGWRNTVSLNIGVGPQKNQRRTLRARSYVYIRSLYPDDTRLDAPVFYADYDQDHWLVGPCPDNDYPFEGIVYRLPDLLGESNQQNYLTKFVPNMLLYECLKALEPFIRNDSRIAIWKQLSDDEFNSASAQDAAKASDRAQIRNSS